VAVNFAENQGVRHIFGGLVFSESYVFQSQTPSRERLPYFWQCRGVSQWERIAPPFPRWSDQVIVVNTEFIPKKRIVDVRGLVQGNTVRAKHVGRDIAAGLKNVFGGELRGYTELLVESRREAMSRMMEQAEQLGANAVVNVRFATSSIAANAAELYCYGTAVVVEDAPTG